MQKSLYKCNICYSKSLPIFRSKILNKYKSDLSQCINCGFCQYNNVIWLKELHKKHLPISDTGSLKRNILMAFSTRLFLTKHYNTSNILDYGSGYGIYTRILNDMGLNIYSYDKYCTNLFSQDRLHKKGTEYKCVTGFELLEHLIDPHKFIKIIKNAYKPETLIFSTQIVSRKPERSWWYFMPDIGQHVSFYTKYSLQLLANKYGYRYINIKFIHMFTKKDLNTIQFAYDILSSLLLTPFNYLWK